jgi:hypothetical protein
MAYAKRNYGVKPHMLTSKGEIPPKRMRQKDVDNKPAAEPDFPKKSKQKSSWGWFEPVRKALQ